MGCHRFCGDPEGVGVSGRMQEGVWRGSGGILGKISTFRAFHAVFVRQARRVLGSAWHLDDASLGHLGAMLTHLWCFPEVHFISCEGLSRFWFRGASGPYRVG
eukprot:5703377-Karenia_brevis.AAC.1